VAVLLNKCNLEFVSRWLDQPPVNPEVRKNILRNTGWKGIGGLAEDVRYYGRLVRERTIAKIGHLYPKVKLSKEYGGHEANVIAWLWARTVKCLNPACGADIPLIRSFRISKKQGGDIFIVPMISEKKIQFIVKEEKSAKGTVSKKGVTCLVCKESRKLVLFREKIKVQGPMNSMGLMPLCMIVDTGKGRIVSSFTAEMTSLIKRPTCMDEYELPRKANWWCRNGMGI
jgi:putative DNA methylase